MKQDRPLNSGKGSAKSGRTDGGLVCPQVAITKFIQENCENRKMVAFKTPHGGKENTVRRRPPIFLIAASDSTA
jgi:hypothetical protein